MKILIVDDEPAARDRVKRMILSLRPTAVVSEARNGRRALEQIAEDAPDVVLLDIRMPVMDGLETARHLGKLKDAPVIIFLTAYEEHSLKAFESHAIDYLLKPVSPERLDYALKRARILSNAQLHEVLLGMEQKNSYRRFISIVTGRNIELIPVTDILYFRAEHGYVMTGLENSEEKLLDEPLKSLQQEFAGLFIRSHRNTLVAITKIARLQKRSGGGWDLCLRNSDTLLPVSRRHFQDVKKALKKPH